MSPVCDSDGIFIPAPLQHRLCELLSRSQFAGAGFQDRVLPPSSQLLSLPAPSPTPPPGRPVQKFSAAKSLFCGAGAGEWALELGGGKGGNCSLRGKRDLQVPDWSDSGWRPRSSSCCRRCWPRCPRCCWRCCWWSFSVSSVWSSVALRVLLQYGTGRQGQLPGSRRGPSRDTVFGK